MTNFALGLSPCPNDTFIFHALLHNLVGSPISAEPFFADVEELNARAIAGQFPVTKISLGVYPLIASRYQLLNTGAALGWGVGPLIVARNTDFDPATAKIAIPGRNTTANLLLDLNGSFGGVRQEMLFSDVMSAVTGGDADLGVIIHEGRFTHEKLGLVKILDLGEWWEATHGLPLPLGAIAIRRDVEREHALAIEEAIGKSLEYAWQNPEASQAFVASHAQELDPDVTKAHINTFVTKYSRDLGEEGRNAIRSLVARKLDSASHAPFFLSDCA